MKNTGKSRHKIIRKVLEWTGISLGSILVLVVAALCVATWWLTPERLTRIVNDNASKALNADVRASNIRFTIWSTFPHLDIELDSLYVRSRNLDSIPDSARAQLPANADFLASTSRMHGGINLLKLIGGRIWLRDVQVDSLKINLVDVTDSLNNYDIADTQGSGRVPYFNIDCMAISHGGQINYTSLPSKSAATVRLSKASLMPGGKKNVYKLALLGNVSATSDRIVILDRFPIGLDGDVEVRFHPFGVSASDYRVLLGSIDGRMSMDVDLGEDARLNQFNYCLEDFTLADLYQMIPEGSWPELRKVSADLSIDCTARLTTPYNFASAFLPSVRVDFNVPRGEIDYSMSDDRRYAIKNVKLKGCLVFDGRHPEESYVEIPEFMLQGYGAEIVAEGRVDNLTTEPQVHARIQGRADLARLSGELAELRPYRLGGKLEFQSDMGFRLADNTLYGNLLDLNIDSPSASAVIDGKRISADGVAITLRNLSSETGVNLERKGAVLRNLDLNVKSRHADIASGKTRVSVEGANLDLKASRLGTPKVVQDYPVPAAWTRDLRSLAYAPHTPEYVKVNLSDRMRRLVNDWQANLNVHIASVGIVNPGYGAPFGLKSLDLTACFDSVSLHRVALNSGRSGGMLSGKVSNLRQFLLSRTPAPFRVALNLDLDTLQLNQLARAYAAAHPEIAEKDEDEKDEKPMVADTIADPAYILPRNLYADIHATAQQLRYINLHLFDMLADVSIADGNAAIDRMHIGADFGNADMNLKYSTADLQNMCLDANLAINDVNVVKFFENFHSLLAMMPQMKNLSGMLSADVKGRVRLFPNMNLMVPSLWADANLEGWDLVVHQNRFIRNVTNMLLIPNNDDLQIADMKVHAGIHSNLLEVFPFMFEVEKYKLSLGGLNNFNGDLYYHIGVEDWPLKFPFGINVKGTYSHPVLKFGGKAWHDSNGAKIAGGIQDYDRINLVEMTRKYGQDMVHTAATYEGD